MAAAEKTKLIAQGLKKVYPADVFLGANGSFFATFAGDCIYIGSDEGLFKLSTSSADSIGNSSLKQLLHCLMWESRKMSRESRRDHLRDSVKQMLPNHCVNIFVLSPGSREPFVTDEGKGKVFFNDSEFGDHVFVYLL